MRAQGTSSSNWRVALGSRKADSLLQVLGWTRETLTTLQDKLDAVDCISVASGEPCTIGYHRSGMGKYSYALFQQPLRDSLKQVYNDGCSYIQYRDRVVLEYEGSAVGPQCFEGRR